MSVKTTIFAYGSVPLYKDDGNGEYESENNSDKLIFNYYNREQPENKDYIIVRIDDINLKQGFIKLGELLECLEEIKKVALI